MSPPAAESVVRFACDGEPLVGILSPAGGDTGVLVVVGGPQYRAGSHRQFVLLARALARAGYPTLRFDYRGMGDGGGDLRTFEHCQDDIAAAIDAFFQARPGLRQVVLWGLCDGASAALLYLDRHADPRVSGVALLNPWVRSEASLAKTHVKHYYLQRLGEREFWLKLLSGRVAVGALTGFVRAVLRAFGRGGGGGPEGGAGGAEPAFQLRMARAWTRFSGRILLLLSERDLTAQEFVEFSAAQPAWQKARAQRPATVVQIDGADHTCSVPGTQARMEQETARWLAAGWPLADAR